MPVLDFRKAKKQYLTIKLDDENQTKLSVMQPTKQLFELMVSMNDNIEAIQDNDIDALGEVYGVAAQLLSRNREGLIYGKTDLEKILDFEDIVLFLQTYSKFVENIISAKN